MPDKDFAYGLTLSMMLFGVCALPFFENIIKADWFFAPER
jgi:hypothetical protein